MSSNPPLAFDPKTLFSDKWLPEATRHLGTTYVEGNIDKGYVKLSFMPRREFLNPRGGVQGGFLTAMLDECFSFAAFTHMKGAFATPTIEMTTQFLRPVKIEPLIGEGQVIKAGRSIVFSEAKLYRADGKLCAKTTASTMLVPLEPV